MVHFCDNGLISIIFESLKNVNGEKLNKEIERKNKIKKQCNDKKKMQYKAIRNT